MQLQADERLLTLFATLNAVGYDEENKEQGMVERQQADRLFAALEPRVSAGYRTWPNILHESVIRAIEVRLAAPADRERLIHQEEAASFPLVRSLANRLAEYEATGQTISEFKPRLLAALNDETLLQNGGLMI